MIDLCQVVYHNFIAYIFQSVGIVSKLFVVTSSSLLIFLLSSAILGTRCMYLVTVLPIYFELKQILRYMLVIYNLRFY